MLGAWHCYDMLMDIRSQLQDRLRTALRSHDHEAVRLYRTTLSAIANAEAVPVDVLPPAGSVEASRLGIGAADGARRVLTEEMVRGVVESEIAELSAAADAPGIPVATRDQMTREVSVLAELLAK